MRLIVVGDCVKLQHRTHIPSEPNKNSCVDRKGIKRGACKEDDCSDCDSYYHDPQHGSQCQYCGCYPTKHRKIDGSSDDLFESESAVQDKTFPPKPPEIHIIDDDGSDTMIYEIDDDGTITIPDDEDEPRNLQKKIDSCSLSNLLTPKDMNKRLPGNTVNKENTPQKQLTSRATFTTLTSHLPREEMYEFCVPTNIPNFYFNGNVLMSNKVGERIDSSNHIFLLRWISWSMFNFKLATEKDYTEVAKLTMKRYPELLSSLPDDKKDVADMAKVLKDLLHKQTIEKKSTPQSTTDKSNTRPGPKSKSTLRTVPRTESIRISNNFSTVNVESSVSSVKSVNSKRPAILNRSPKPSNPVVLPAPPVQKFVTSKQFENGQAHIQREMRKHNPSTTILQTFLSSIRKDRVILAKSQNYTTHLEEFPCLRLHDIVLWEFIQQEQLQCTVECLKKKWVDALPAMVEYFLCGSKKDYVFDSKTNDLSTMEILQTISTPAFFGPEPSAGRMENRSSHVLEVFQDNILPLFVFPQRGDPPRLFSLGGSDEVFVYRDGQVIFTGTILDALIVLVAVYHVFSLIPHPDAQASFAFVFGVFLKDKGIDKYMNHNFAYEALRAIVQS